MSARILSISLALLVSSLASLCPAQSGFLGVYDNWNDVNLAGLVSLNGNATFAVTDRQVNVSVDGNNVPDGVTVTAEIHGAVTADLEALPQVSGPIDVWLPLAAIALPPIQFGPDIVVLPVAGAFAHITGNVATDARIGLMQNFEMTVFGEPHGRVGTQRGAPAERRGSPRRSRHPTRPRWTSRSKSSPASASRSSTSRAASPCRWEAPPSSRPSRSMRSSTCSADPWGRPTCRSTSTSATLAFPGIELFRPRSIPGSSSSMTRAGRCFRTACLLRDGHELSISAETNATAVVPLPRWTVRHREHRPREPAIPREARLGRHSGLRDRGAAWPAPASGRSTRRPLPTATSSFAATRSPLAARASTASRPRALRSGARLLVPARRMIEVNDIVATDDGGAIVAGSIAHLAAGLGRPLAAKIDQNGRSRPGEEFDLGARSRAPGIPPSSRRATAVSCSRAASPTRTPRSEPRRWDPQPPGGEGRRQPRGAVRDDHRDHLLGRDPRGLPGGRRHVRSGRAHRAQHACGVARRSGCSRQRDLVSFARGAIDRGSAGDTPTT